ncbi:lytic polysaccharide monooxygenase [Streptomyces sp. NPDC059176]|uniref:lytic polysaccharide monooxygenase auxiliary activity family 9 protein n=1 Tax=Streptomyces sp. NPDC059176 TaxID=3346758 RepID=UPI00367A312C
MSNLRSFASRAMLVGSAQLILLAIAAGPAGAHGAPTDPVSRAVACGPQGNRSGSAACTAAVKAGGSTAFEEWDNLRVSGVAGRDRQKIPDGKLCSGGLDTYKGLDLARDDWPATALTAGADFTLTYTSTIPHRGTFSVYLTKEGYDPRAPLSWADLEDEPFLTVKDPALRNGAYRLRGELPAGRTGRQLMYTIWRNTGTPDTYYSCSDVVLTRADTAAGDKARPEEGTSGNSPAPEGGPARSARDTVPEQPAPRSPSHPAGAAATPTAASTDPGGFPITATAAAAALTVAGAAVVFVRRRRRPARVHHGQRHRRP